MKAKLLIAVILGITLATTGCSSKNKGGDGELGENDLNFQRDGRFGEGGIPLAEGAGMFRDIHFDYDSSTISDQARQDIEFNVQVLEQHPNLRISLEGHCDERGTAEYNLALGSRRARAVMDLLVSQGVTGSRLDTISYGEELPLDPATSEAAFAQNRRVHFSPFSETKK